MDEPKRNTENADFGATNAETEATNAETEAINAKMDTEEEVKNADIDPLTFNANNNLDEEFATEVLPTPPTIDRKRNVDENLIQPEEDVPREQPVDKATFEKGRGLGLTALILSIVSLFIFNLSLGAISAIMGIFAYRQGQRSLGIWSIVIGSIAILIGISLLTLFNGYR
jgi:hypothetical protein